MSEQLHYQWAGVSAEDYASDLDQLWAELQRPDSALSREAKELGLDITPLRDIDRKDAIDVHVEGEGFDPATITIIVVLAPVAIAALESSTAAIKAMTPIIHDVWKHILLPRILQRRGGDALIEKE